MKPSPPSEDDYWPCRSITLNSSSEEDILSDLEDADRQQQRKRQEEEETDDHPVLSLTPLPTTADSDVQLIAKTTSMSSNKKTAFRQLCTFMAILIPTVILFVALAVTFTAVLVLNHGDEDPLPPAINRPVEIKKNAEGFFVTSSAPSMAPVVVTATVDEPTVETNSVINSGEENKDDDDDEEEESDDDEEVENEEEKEKEEEEEEDEEEEPLDENDDEQEAAIPTIAPTPAPTFILPVPTPQRVTKRTMPPIVSWREKTMPPYTLKLT